MPYNSGTGAYERRATTVIDATPDGDTVAVAIDVKLDQGIDDYVVDLNHHKTNGNHYPATSVHTDSRFLKQSPAGAVDWADGVVAADAALKDMSNVASGAIAPEKLAWTNFPRGSNLIINGGFRVNQRAYVSGTNTTGANQYTLDRWRVVTSGQNITLISYLNGNKVTAPAGGIEQVIEWINIKGGTYVMNWVGTATATVNGSARSKGESFSLTAATNVTVKFSSGTVAMVQLEEGSIVTNFESRDIETEVSLCKRFFNRVAVYARAYAAVNGAVHSAFTVLESQMRTSPTITHLSNTSTLNVSTYSLLFAPPNTIIYTLQSSLSGDMYRNDQFILDSEL